MGIGWYLGIDEWEYGDVLVSMNGNWMISWY